MLKQKIPPIYFDNNSTTKPYKEVVGVIATTLTDHYANPSTQYKIGRDAKKIMTDARTNIKKMLGIKKTENLLFTSSATESNNIVVRGRTAYFQKTYHKLPHVIISSIEHSSIYETCKSLAKHKKCTFSIVPTDNNGSILLKELEKQVTKYKKRLALVAFILANNEIGTIQDIQSITKICKGHFIHFDATQYIGRYPISISPLHIDSMTFGSHKFHGPRIGALYLKKCNTIINCCCTGGGPSEYGLRSGTPNISYICGMNMALTKSLSNIQQKYKHVEKLRDYLEQKLLQIIGTKLNAPIKERLYNTISVVLPIKGCSYPLLHFLYKNNIYVNVGSACNMYKRSRVLESIGLTPIQQSSTLRISLSHTNTKKECDRFLQVIYAFFYN